MKNNSRQHWLTSTHHTIVPFDYLIDALMKRFLTANGGIVHKLSIAEQLQERARKVESATLVVPTGTGMALTTELIAKARAAAEAIR